MKALLLVMILSGFGFQTMAGQDGGGGDAVYCTADGDRFPRDGYYILDYIVAGGDQTWVSHRDEIEHLEYILSLVSKIDPKDPNVLGDFFPKLKNNFQWFINEYKLKDSGKSEQWIATELPLVDIPDEKLPIGYTLPENCKAELRQAVIKINPGKYYYDNKLERKLAQTDKGRQLNIRNVHEMLRSSYSNSALIRKWVDLLHQPNISELLIDENIDQTLLDYEIMSSEERVRYRRLRNNIGEESIIMSNYHRAYSLIYGNRYDSKKSYPYGLMRDLREKDKFIQGYIPVDDEVKELVKLKERLLLGSEYLTEGFSILEFYIKKTYEYGVIKWDPYPGLPGRLNEKCRYYKMTVDEALGCHRENHYEPLLQRADGEIEFINSLLSRLPR